MQLLSLANLSARKAQHLIEAFESDKEARSEWEERYKQGLETLEPDGGLTEEDALEVAISTWNNIVPVVHYSESRNIEQEDDKIKPQAHSDYVYDYIDTYGNEVDIMVEAKAKELAVLKYKELHG